MSVREVPVTSAGSVHPDAIRELRSELATLPTLADVLAWARGRQPPMSILDIVTQDEYTHDVVVSSGSDEIYLAFDTN